MRRLLFALGILAFLPFAGISADPPASAKKEEKKEDKKGRVEPASGLASIGMMIS